MGFNADDHEIKLAPTGTKCTMMLVKSKKKESGKNPGNFYLDCQFKIIGGDYANRVIFNMYNLENSNPVAEEMGKAELANLMKAVRVASIGSMWDLTDLMNIPFEGELKLEESDDYGDSNKIKTYSPASGDTKHDVPPTGNTDWGGGKGDKKKDKKKKGKKGKEDAPPPEEPKETKKGKKDKKGKKGKKGKGGGDGVPF